MFSKKVQLIFLYFLTTLGITIIYNFNPAESSNIYPPSLTREWGGFYCAGCGMLRGLHHLLHGNLQAALRFNPLLIIGLPYFFYWITPYFLKYFYNLEAYTIQSKNIQLVAMTIVCLLYGILRNTSYPFLFWLVPPT
jgi:hypothetical protein